MTRRTELSTTNSTEIRSEAGTILAFDAGSTTIPALTSATTSISASSLTGMIIQESRIEPEKIIFNRNTWSKHKEIGPGLYLRFVKSKLNPLEKERLASRLTSLQYLLKTTEETCQQGLKDALQKEMAVIVVAQQAAACGYDEVVDSSVIEKYRGLTKTRVDFGLLETFPRPIPKEIRTIISEARRKKLFDYFFVLYHNPTQEQIRSTKDKVIEKDPILFGSFAFDPDKPFYICDWVDELCDLTFDKFVTKVKTVDPEFKPGDVKPLTQKEMEYLRDSVTSKHKNLKNARPSTYRSLAVVSEIESDTFSWDNCLKILKALWKSWRERKTKQNLLSSNGFNVVTRWD